MPCEGRGTIGRCNVTFVPWLCNTKSPLGPVQIPHNHQFPKVYMNKADQDPSLSLPTYQVPTRDTYLYSYSGYELYLRTYVPSDAESCRESLHSRSP